MNRLLPRVVPVLMVVLAFVLAMGYLGIHGIGPLAALEPDAAVVPAETLTVVPAEMLAILDEMAPGATLGMLSLADEAVAPAAVDTVVYDVLVIGTGALGLTLTILTIAWSRSSRRRRLSVSLSGWVRFPLKHPTAA